MHSTRTSGEIIIRFQDVLLGWGTRHIKHCNSELVGFESWRQPKCTVSTFQPLK
eukprot:m.34632 g.34632  ORF g.34632 m.34632 type:complete len:54 (-) comp9787_c1_seq1:59-220(-)